MRTPRLLCVLVIMAVALPARAAAMSDEFSGGANNVVIAMNTTDYRAAVRSNLQVGFVAADTVTSSNLAQATSFACIGCRTVAVAVQAVLITRSASTIAPKNAAVAVNTACNGCATFAYAWQYVLTTDSPVTLGESAHMQINSIRNEIASVATSDVSFDEMTFELDQLTARFKSVIDLELQLVGASATGTLLHASCAAPCS